MSVKKSYDVEPKKGRAAKEEKPAPKPARRSHPRLSQRSPRRPLRERRREDALRSVMTVGVVLVLLSGIGIFILWRPEVRISTLEVPESVESDALQALAKEALKGTYGYVIPRDSFFFYPEQEIRARILDAFPHLAAVDVERTGFSSLSIETLPRVAAFVWCGEPSALGSTGPCYYADAEGFVFALSEGTDTSLVSVFASLTQDETHTSFPIRATVEGVPSLPDVLRFVHEVNELGVPVASIAIRGDEADLFVLPSTRITYVIGKEEEAQKNAQAAFGSLSLTDGTIEYVDLRFEGKVYLKRNEP